MTTNLGTIDRVLRMLVGLALIMSPLLNVPAVWENANYAYVSMAVGLVLFGTGLFQFCPVYRLFGLSTCES